VKHALIAIGAHDGTKLRPTVEQLAPTGRVLLVEALPDLYARLTAAYAGTRAVATINACITTIDGPVRFTRAKPGAEAIHPYADQLGSMVAGHATAHHPALAQHFETIELPGVSMRSLLRREDVTALDALVLDTEGHDADLLLDFPFDSLVPQRIFFEFKHADGPFRIGRKLGQVLIVLDTLGYAVQAKDAENMLAIHRSAPQG
jgi:FkbM family methyltransferase